MAVVDEITRSAVHSYARAAIQVARRIMRLQQQGYEALIVPSRGAVPIASAARTYGRSVLAPLVASEDRMRLAKMQFESPLQKVLYLPYTADAGPIGVDGLSTANVRRYWTRVLAAISRQDWENPHYRFHRFTRDYACAVGHHDPYERFVKSSRFIFIDTVLSGRAVAEIADSFAAEGLEEAHFILLLDDFGRGMKPEFARRIRQLEADGRATLVEVETLFTEDQGPAVSTAYLIQAHDQEEDADDWKRWFPNLSSQKSSGNHITILRTPHVLSILNLFGHMSDRGNSAYDQAAQREKRLVSVGAGSRRRWRRRW